MKPYFLYLPLILLLAACSSSSKKEESKEASDNNTVTLSAEQVKNAGIVLGKTEQQTITAHLKVNGIIDVPPQNMVSISAPLGGYLRESKLLPGMHVRKGEVIAVMEDPQYIQLQQDFLMAKAKAVFTESEYQRQKALNASKASSDKSFQLAEADYHSQQIQIKALYEKLKLIGIQPEHLNENNLSRSINIPAPIDGFVSKVNVNIGKYVSPTEVLFDIVNPTDIHLALTVFEKDVQFLYNGQRVIAYSNGNPEKKYRCEIILIGQDLSKDRSVEVHCHFEEYDKSLIPGMFMNGDIELKNTQAYTLPEDAIVSYANKQYVFLAKSEDQFELHEIKTGSTEKGRVELINGAELSPKKIVVKGAYSLLMALKNTEE